MLKRLKADEPDGRNMVCIAVFHLTVAYYGQIRVSSLSPLETETLILYGVSFSKCGNSKIIQVYKIEKEKKKR